MRRLWHGFPRDRDKVEWDWPNHNWTPIILVLCGQKTISLEILLNVNLHRPHLDEGIYCSIFSRYKSFSLTSAEWRSNAHLNLYRIRGVKTRFKIQRFNRIWIAKMNWTRTYIERRALRMRWDYAHELKL